MPGTSFELHPARSAEKDLVQVITLAKADLLVVVGPGSNAKTFRERVELARQQPGKLKSLDGAALATCLCCQDTERCRSSFEAGEASHVEEFCPNAQKLRGTNTAER